MKLHFQDINMTDSQLYILLDVIFRNGSVKRLIRQGLNYHDIAVQTNKAIMNGLIYNENNKIVLTHSGIETLKKLELEYKKTNKKEWIEKDFKSQIAKIDKNSIFLPRQSELNF